MALLLNRKYGSRLECLYYILKSLYNTYSTTNSFSLSDIKFDSDNENNVHKYCALLHENFGIKYCPYLLNELNESKCYATQSKISDSTKSKAVSDIGRSFEALGFINKSSVKNKYYITPLGEQWVNTSFDSKEWFDISLHSVLSYGPVLGFIHQANLIDSDIFNISDIYISYPQTEESVLFTTDEGIQKSILLTNGSQKDSNTRTRSKLINWCISTGIFDPSLKVSDTNELPQIKQRNIVNATKMSNRKLLKTDLFKFIVTKKHYVQNPLSYEHLHKDVKALRENGIKDIRTVSLKYNELVLNRRFVLLYVLNKFSNDGLTIEFDELLDNMKVFSHKFFINDSNIEDILSSEFDITNVAGLPCHVSGNTITPLTTINESILTYNAPSDIIDIAEKIYKNMR